MLIEVNSKTFSSLFPKNPHPFVSIPFIELNKDKAERVVMLVEDSAKPEMGMVAGIINNIIKTPFSAPFGGFHYRSDAIYTTEIDLYINSLKQYLVSQNLTGIDITLPPDIYHVSFNAKIINSLLRNGFISHLPDITNWVDLQLFKERFTHKNSREIYNQALRNNLHFDQASDIVEKELIYNLIKENRSRFNRPIYMTFDDVLSTGKIWPAEFFKVTSNDDEIVASAIFYSGHPGIAYAVFWGDSESGRFLRAMDFLAFNLWTYYKKLGYAFIDLGTSTESGIPNAGLLRFKESHEATSSLRYKFSLHLKINE